MNIGTYILSAPKTIYYNLIAFPIKTAVKMPVIFHYKVKIKGLRKNCITLEQVRTAVVNVGFFEGIGGNGATKTILDFRRNGKLNLGEKCCIGKGSYFLMDGADITIGDSFHGGASLIIVARAGVNIGNDCLTAWNCTIMDSDGHDIIQNEKIVNNPRSITIGDHVWLGAYCCILKGSKVPSDSVVGSGSQIATELTKQSAVYVSRNGMISAVKNEINWKQ